MTMMIHVPATTLRWPQWLRGKSLNLAKVGSVVLSIVLATIVTSCSKTEPNQALEDGNASEGIYVSSEIGWSMAIPAGWNILADEQVERYQATGEELIEETLGEAVVYDGFKNLLHYQKDQFNIFQSSSEPFVIEYEGEWSENNQNLKELLLDTYHRQGIRTTSTDIKTETIDGVVFEVYDISIIGPNGKVLITQTMYSSWINGYDFGANMTYNSDETRDVMLNAWKQSTFVKSE
jgi:hypothetical protein